MSHTHEPASLDATHGCAEIHDDAQRVALAWRSLRRGTAARRMRALAWAPDPPQLDMGQIDSLDLLVRHRSWTMCEFATALGIDPSTATRAVQRLVNAGLAERVPDPTDGRVVQVVITDAGRAAHDEVFQRRVELLSYIVGHFRRTELHQFAEMLERFNTSVSSFFAERSVGT